MLWGEELSESWSDNSNEPHVPDAELFTIPEFAELIKMDDEEIFFKIHDNNLILPDDKSTIRKVADVNKITPKNFYEVILAKEKNTIHTEGSGYGRKTLEDLCEELNINPDTEIHALSESGIHAERNARIKEIALANNILPIDIVNLIRQKTELK
jgi:hypothetical protein